MIFILIGLIIAFVMFPQFRYMIIHPIVTITYGFKDIKDRIVHKRVNECKEFGKVVMFTASGSKAFGSGKTLSMVRWVRWLYKRYNGLKVWDDELQQFVNQRVIIISNVELLDIPYIPFRGRDQFVNIDKLEHTKHDVLCFVIDEAGMEFNSRNYKENLPTDFLVRLLQVRHNKVLFVMTAQRFGFVDKVLRSICGVVTTCKIWWRIVRLQDFDAYALENSQTPELIQPLSTRYYFAKDDLFNAYDTTYNVQKLKDQLKDGELLETTEILNKIGDSGSNPEVARPRWRKKYRNMKK